MIMILIFCCILPGLTYAEKVSNTMNRRKKALNERLNKIAILNQNALFSHSQISKVTSSFFRSEHFKDYLI